MNPVVPWAGRSGGDRQAPSPTLGSRTRDALLSVFSFHHFPESVLLGHRVPWGTQTSPRVCFYGGAGRGLLVEAAVWRQDSRREGELRSDLVTEHPAESSAERGTFAVAGGTLLPSCPGLCRGRVR